MKEVLHDVALEALLAYGPIILACVIGGICWLARHVK